MNKRNFYLSFISYETQVDKVDKIDAFYLKVLLAFVFTL